MQCLVRRQCAISLSTFRRIGPTHIGYTLRHASCYILNIRSELRASYLVSLGLYRSISAFSRQDDTIYALSTAPGRAALAIIRCSGPASLAIHAALCPNSPAPKPRRAALRVLRNPINLEDVLDPGALVLYFPGPASATGEDVLELHVHGGPATVRAVLAGVAAVPKAFSTNSSQDLSKLHQQPKRNRTIRPAEPGEFTQRAFQRARLSLPEVEALSATLSAETESQRRAASGSGSSSFAALTARYESWREALLAARGELEALLDFAEDQHFDDAPGTFVAGVAARVKELKSSIQRAANNAARGELLRAGVAVALIGPPNAGKSSLLNAAAGRDAAIVSSEAGTTRDVVDVGVDVGGFACRFGDLAGLRGGDIGAVEREGMRRARERALAAPIVVIVLPVTHRAGEGWRLEYNDEIADVVTQLDPHRQHLVLAANKVDLLPEAGAGVERNVLEAINMDDLPPALRALPVHAISCSPNYLTGVQPLLTAIAAACADLTDPITGNDGIEADLDALGLAASERQRVLLLECVDFLDAFLERAGLLSPTADDMAGNVGTYEHGEDVDVVLAAEDLRGAADCLSRLTGRGEAGDVEEVLGVVFEKFCVGK